MTRPKLATTLQTLGHTAPLKDGAVRLPGFELEWLEVSPIIQAFRRMVRGVEFDVSEMALTTYLTARAFDKGFTALPVFLVRGFHHGAILHNTKVGIGNPKDLEGRRVGVSRGYTVTTGVWVRGLLQHEYGVNLDKITWVLSGDEHVAEFRPPGNVQSLEPGKTLESALICGELAAAIGIKAEHPDIAPLIPDAATHAFGRLQRDAYYPINHTVVVKDGVLQKYPHVAVELFEAFGAAKRQYLERLRNAQIAAPSAVDRMYARVLEITGSDPLPYGIEPNRGMLETLMGYACEQRILPRSFALEEVFAPGTAHLIA
ncbi:MAG: ABC transporter substrate-binding protein [Gammaproteobacteria bacterium]|nr:ABC transporter substrate-binding protein [Gammaproteobacteria bacterium]